MSIFRKTSEFPGIDSTHRFNEAMERLQATETPQALETSESFSASKLIKKVSSPLGRAALIDGVKLPRDER